MIGAPPAQGEQPPVGDVARDQQRHVGEEIARVGRVIYGHVPHPDPEILRERFRYYGGPA